MCGKYSASVKSVCVSPRIYASVDSVRSFFVSVYRFDITPDGLLPVGSQVSALAASTQSPGARVVGAGGRMLVHALRHLHE